MEMKVCFVLIFLLGVISVYAKYIEEDDEELLQEVREFLEVEHGEGVGKDFARILETRGKKKKKPGKTGSTSGGKKKKKPGKTSGSNDNTGSDNGASGKTVPVMKNSKKVDVPVKEASLEAHNLIRKLHGVPPLKWNEALTKTAQKHADILAAKQTLFHSTGNYGENVGYKSISIKPTNYSPCFTIFAWWIECEKPGYDFGKPGNQAGTGHFTQVVWKSTTEVGCAIAMSTKGSMDSTYLVCQYLPPGNYEGKYGDNVPRLKKPGSGPRKAIDIAEEGCVDYSSGCSTYSSLCSSNQPVKDTCCDTCSKK